MASKETSTRGAGNGQKLSSGTRNQVVKDLQHVHKLFPTAEPDRDFYRKHGKFADAAWKEHFPRFKDFVAAARPTLTPFAGACRYFEQATKLLKQHGKNLSEQEIRELDDIFQKVSWLVPALNDYSDRMITETFEAMAEEARIKAEEYARAAARVHEELATTPAAETALRDRQRASAATFETMAEEARIEAEHYKRAATVGMENS
jgi:hypothetical protein